MNWDIAQTILRTILKAGAGALIARGLIQSGEAEQIVGAIMLVSGLVWGIMHRKQPSDLTSSSSSQNLKP